MNYSVWVPVDGVIKTALVYNMSRCGTVYIAHHARIRYSR